MTNKPKIIQIMPLIGNAAHRYTDSDVIGVALMDNGNLMPIVIYDDDKANYFIGVHDTTKEAFYWWDQRVAQRRTDIKIAEKKLAEWKDPIQAGHDILTYAKNYDHVHPGTDLVSIVEDILDLPPEEAILIVKGKKEITADQCVDLCESLHIPLSYLPLQDGLPELPF